MLIMQPSICSDLAPVWQVVGWLLWAFKIIIPILIIIWGVIDLGKAVVASKDDEVKKAIKSLVMRAIAGIVVFFIPTLIGAIFGIVGEFKENATEYAKCRTCITNPGGDVCGEAACNANGKKWDSSKQACN